MAIIGAKYWDQFGDGETQLGYVQTRSAIENMFKRHNLTIISDLAIDPDNQDAQVNLSKGRYWLETCGDHTGVNCGLSIGAIQQPSSDGSPGSWIPRPPDKLMLYFNDERNEAELTAVRDVGDNIMNNEIPQYYPLAMKRVFGVDCEYVPYASHDDIVGYLQQGFAVQVCLINPGHFIAIVAYDQDADEFIYIDPWPENPLTPVWYHGRMNRQAYQNVNPFVIVYKGLVQ